MLTTLQTRSYKSVLLLTFTKLLFDKKSRDLKSTILKLTAAGKQAKRKPSGFDARGDKAASLFRKARPSLLHNRHARPSLCLQKFLEGPINLIVPIFFFLQAPVITWVDPSSPTTTSFT